LGDEPVADRTGVVGIVAAWWRRQMKRRAGRELAAGAARENGSAL